MKALQFGALLSDYMDSVDKKVAQFFTEILEATAASDCRPTAGPGGAPGAGKVRVRDALQQTLRVSAAHLTTQTPAMRSTRLCLMWAKAWTSLLLPQP